MILNVAPTDSDVTLNTGGPGPAVWAPAATAAAAASKPLTESESCDPGPEFKLLGCCGGPPVPSESRAGCCAASGSLGNSDSEAVLSMALVVSACHGIGGSGGRAKSPSLAEAAASVTVRGHRDGKPPPG
jgi:hypothetical protein